MNANPTLSNKPVAAVETRAQVITQPDNRVKQIAETGKPEPKALELKKISEPVEELKQEEDPNRTEPKNVGEKLSVKLYNTIKDLTNKTGLFSRFEMSMAGLGCLLTGFSPYWLSYFCASTVEMFENEATSKNDKKMPKFVTGLFDSLCKLWRVKDKQGQPLSWEKALSQGTREKAIGTFNFTLSLFTLTYSLAKPFLGFFGIGQSKKKEASPLRKKIDFVAKAILPIINANLMWASSAGKILLGHVLARLPRPPKIKLEDGSTEVLDVAGHLQSGNEDKICGLESLGLMVGHMIERINPVLGKAYDTCLGIIISAMSCDNGYTGMKGAESNEEGIIAKIRRFVGFPVATETETESARPLYERYPLGAIYKGSVGNFFYGFVRTFCKWLGLELPQGHDLVNLIKNNTSAQQESLLQRLNGAH